MKKTRAHTDSSQLAASIAPEDLKRGQYVCVLNVILEYPSFMWCCDASEIPPHEPVRVQFTSSSGEPLKIKAICLPFVFVRSPNGTSKTIDVRQTQLVRLPDDYATEVWNQMK